jgi:AAHS family 4-hydroxybenzoate transporter-like MFS transporter
MRGETIIDVSGAVDDQPLRRVSMQVFGLCFIAMLSEGYDLGVVGYAAPGILKGFGIVREQMAPIFSMALLGMLVGALVAGIVGDRFGRKKGVLLSCVAIALASFACAEAPTIGTLFWCRFAVGLGLGGLLPNITALMTEFLPKKVRGAFTTYAFMGITFGGIIPGLFTGLLAENQWRELFVIGGLIPLIALPILMLFLPESLKFLAVRGKRPTQIRKWLSRLAPEIAIPDDARFVINEPPVEPGRFAPLFKGGLKVITPLLWACFVAIMLVNFFINSWMNVVLRDIGFSHAESAHTASLYYVGGVIGGLIIGFALDRVGAIVLAFTTAAGAVVTMLLGAFHQSHAVVDVLMILIGFSVLGSQVGMSSLAGMLYQTAIRSKGSGTAHAIGRIGAIGGPLIAGALIAQKASVATLFSVPVIPMLVAALCFFLITWRWTGRMLGIGFSAIHAREALKEADRRTAGPLPMSPVPN